MSHSLLGPGRRPLSMLGVALAVLLAAMAALGAPSLGSGAASAAPTPKTTIAITSAFTQTDPVPDTIGRGRSYVVQGQPFTVTFTVSAPLSTTKSTRLVLTSESPAGSLSIAYDLAAGETSGSIPDAQLDHAWNDVQLKLDVDPSKNTVQPGIFYVDVLKTSLSAPKPPAGTAVLVGVGGGGGIGVPCSPTPADQVCGDLLVPASRTALSNILLSQGCVTCLSDDASSFLQALIALAPAPGSTSADQLLYAEQNPLVFIAKCDKSLCAGKGIKTYKVSVQLAANDPATVSPACAAKGVVDPGKLFCTDYVQSTRDGAGDVLLYVLLTDDLKIIFG